MGALRRVFARSDLRREALETLPIVAYSDPKRPRVRNWSRCPECQRITPRYLFVVDHVDPVIPVHSSFEAMSIDDAVDRLWSMKSNLAPICKECHAKKTAIERKQRALFKKSTC